MIEDAKKERADAIDVARAIAVIGVVFNHSIDGLVTAGIVAAGAPISEINQALYIFRMPALAFLVGVFIPRGVEKYGIRRYVTGRTTLFLYLYVLWFFLQTFAEIATSGVKNNPVGLDALVTIWAPPAHLWFLPFLIVASVLLANLQLWRRDVRSFVGFFTIVIASVAIWGWGLNIFGLRGLSLLAFVAAGTVVGLNQLEFAMSTTPALWVTVGTASATAFLWLWSFGLAPTTMFSDLSIAQDLLSFGGAALGVVVLLAVAVLLSRIPLIAGALAGVGRHTLPIYLAHVIIVAGCRVALARAGVDITAVFVVVAVTAGVLVPVYAARIAQGLRLGWLFELPVPVRWSVRSPQGKETISAIANIPAKRPL